MDIFNQLREAVGANKLVEGANRLNQTARTIDNLRTLLKDNKVSQSVKDRINGLITLVTTRPNLTGINHYFNHFLLRIDPGNQPPVLRELLEVYHQRWKNIERKTAETAFSHMNFDNPVALLLHGSEKSVEALFDILMVMQIEVTVYQMLSRPSESGKDQAERLLENGFAVDMIDDHAVGGILPDIDYVLIGCEAILHDEFIAPAGTHTLLAAARYYKRPVFVLGDSRRIMNTKFFPQNVQNALLGEGRSHEASVWKKPPEGIRVISNDREYVPNYLVDRFMLENDSYTPETLRDQIDKVMVSKFF